MGALHAGHVASSAPPAKRPVSSSFSIFVNPTQFGPSEDLDSLRAPLEHDREVCEKAAADILFAPPTHEVSGRLRDLRPPGTLHGGFEGPKSAQGILTASAPSARSSSTSSNPDIAFFGRRIISRAWSSAAWCAT